MGLQLLVCLECGFESHQGHGCLSLVSVVLPGRGLCVVLIIHPESYQLWCVQGVWWQSPIRGSHDKESGWSMGGGFWWLCRSCCSKYRVIKKSLYTWQLYCNQPVHRDFLITLKNEEMTFKVLCYSGHIIDTDLTNTTGWRYLTCPT
jgi:hypothetical protein